MCKISGSISQKRRGHFDFCAVKCKITAWHRNYLVLVCFRFRAFNLTWTWSYEVSLSNICTKLCTNMPWSTCKLLVQKKMLFCFFPTVNAWLLLTSSKACDWSGRIFSASASFRSLTKETGDVALFHCSWRLAWCQMSDILVAIACGIRDWWKLGWYTWTISY